MGTEPVHRAKTVSGPFARGGQGGCRFAGGPAAVAVPSRVSVALSFSLLLSAVLPAGAQPFLLPTANRALFEAGGEERYFVGTVGKPWTSGTFGCVRSEGWQLHEGLDIRCLQRDRRGEPTDPVLATADGVVAYVNRRPSLSNYGNYVILRHLIEGVEIYSLYAHLSEPRAGLKPGDAVRGGEQIAVMGRSSNTHQAISKDRAHVHFELDLVVHERFPQWYAKTFPGQRNDHGAWNGQNLIGIDPRLLLLEQQRQGAHFSLLQFLRHRTEICRVWLQDPNLSWARRYPMLVRPNPVAQKEGVAGFEAAIDYNGLPFELIPRAASEVKIHSRFALVSVNAAEKQQHPCRKLVLERAGRWQLAGNGQRLVDLLMY